MSSDTRFKQCQLRQGTAVMTAWIAIRGANLGYYVEIPEAGGNWEVVEVYDPVLTARQLAVKQAMDRSALPSIRGR